MLSYVLLLLKACCHGLKYDYFCAKIMKKQKEINFIVPRGTMCIGLVLMQ